MLVKDQNVSVIEHFNAPRPDLKSFFGSAACVRPIRVFKDRALRSGGLHAGGVFGDLSHALADNKCAFHAMP